MELLFVVGSTVVLFFWGLVYFVKDALMKRRCTARTTGNVLSVDEKESVSYEFTVDGARRIASTRMLGHKPNPSNSHTMVMAGQSVEVVYDPHDPDCYRMEIDRSTFMTGVFCEAIVAILLLLLLLIGGLMRG